MLCLPPSVCLLLFLSVLARTLSVYFRCSILYRLLLVYDKCQSIIDDGWLKSKLCIWSFRDLEIIESKNITYDIDIFFSRSNEKITISYIKEVALKYSITFYLIRELIKQNWLLVYDIFSSVDPFRSDC